MPPDSSCGYARARRAGVGYADRAHQLDSFSGRLAPAVPQVDLDGLRDLLAGAHERVERRHRLLKDHADCSGLDGGAWHRCACRADPLLRRALRPLTVAFSGTKIEDGPQDRRLAAAVSPTRPRASPAARSNETPSTARSTPRRVGSRRRRPRRAAAQACRRHAHLCPGPALVPASHSGLKRSENPSPSMASPMPVTTTARPGKVASCHWVVRNCWP